MYVYLHRGGCVHRYIFSVVKLLLLLRQMTCKLFSTCTVLRSFKKLQAVLNLGNVEFEIPIARVELHLFLKKERVSQNLRFNRLSV